MRLDTTYTVNTPEGIALELSPAGPAPRLWAWLVDLLLRGLISLLLFAALALLGEMGIGIALILTFLLEWFYPVYFELRHQGQTPGKKMLDIYVAQADASPITFSASLVRNLLRVVDFLPLFYGFGFASMLLNQRFQRLGDLAANTVVLHKISSNGYSTALNVEAIRPTVPLTLPEQQAIMLFAQRSHTLTPARLDELAQMTDALVAKQPKPTQYLQGIAHWLTGGGRT
ncbi:RDD family protein [Thiothrix subterranea]|uniref:RDD family protein n=1 Tax=Thiothrix subterranea TaxID=2735563 RepID=A0AA51MJE8_9GAMM|nr:RDD family protein [Thiothrix subterranea]MDQ5767737.1 RDD family protein [Thiothrix subterranea]WML85542.1 RDD family protein [Thiothrix subterranea]